MAMSSRVLVVDEIATNRIVLKVKLANACYETLPVSAGADALATAMECKPDLILVDDKVQSMPWRRIAAQIRGQSITADIPIVLLANNVTADLRRDAFRMGVNAVFCKPLDEMLLLSRMRGMIRAKHELEELMLRCQTSSALGLATEARVTPPRGQISLIGAENETTEALKIRLQALLGHKVIIQSRAEALSSSVSPSIDGPDANRPSDAFVIMAEQESIEGFLPCLKDLLVSSSTRFSSILLYAQKGIKFGPGIDPLLGFDLGAREVLFGDTTLEELALLLNAHVTRKQRADGLRARVQQGLSLALTDPLTGLYNRRYAEHHMATVEKDFRLTKKPFAVMLLDLDHFKQVNDTYGHVAGDIVLTEISGRLKAGLRRTDLISRFGGEEFLAILTDTNKKRAGIMAERLRHLIEARPVCLADGTQIPVTVSIGLALSDSNSPQCSAMLQEADVALYASKAEGRNLVTIAAGCNAA